MSHPSMAVPYPPERYRGPDGEASAVVRPATAAHDLEYRAGGTVDYLATTGSTGGEFGLYRWNFGTGVSGPDPHFHRTVTESFFVLSGTVRLFDGTGWVDAVPGDFMFVPQGGLHGFRNESGLPASMLLLFTPGAPREGYFETLKALGEGLSMTEDERTQFYLAHDNHWR